MSRQSNHQPSPPAAIPQAAMTQEDAPGQTGQERVVVALEVRNVPYAECDPAQRAAWDWLWRRLLGPGTETPPALGALLRHEQTRPRQVALVRPQESRP